MVQLVDTWARDFVTDGVPASGQHQPKKAEIREWGTWIEGFVNSSLAVGASRVFLNKAAIDASLSPTDHTLAWVVADPVATNNGVYRKIGGPGTGSWQRVADLPYSFIKATNAGAGSPNAIQATTSLPLPAADGAALIMLNVFEPNTGSPVTVSFNGGAPLTIKTNSGNDVVALGLAEGMLLLGMTAGETFRIVTDQVPSALLAAVELAAAQAVEAKEAVLAALSGVISGKATLAEAIADDPAVDPEYYVTDFFDTNYVANSGAKYRKVGPGTGPGEFQNGNGIGYRLVTANVRPEMFGAIGNGVADDTAAWEELAAYCSNKLRVTIEAEGEYRIGGSEVLFDTVGYPELKLGPAVFRQTANFSSTLNFVDCGTVTVRRGRAYGRGGAAGEFNGASLSWNGVAFIKATNCDYADIEGVQAWDHAGGCIVLLGVRRRRLHWNIIEGIGPDYISPFDNGSDFGIMCQPTDNSVGWIFEDDFENNRIFNTGSGIQSVMTKTHRLSKNHIGPVCGEHCVYGIELDGVHSEGNYLHDAPVFGWKNQLENYAGRFIGEAFVAGKVYQPGELVRAFSVLWERVTAGSQPAFANDGTWKVSPLYYRNGGISKGNVVERTGAGLGATVADVARWRNLWIDGMVYDGDIIIDSVASAMNVDRMINSDINVKMYGSQGYGIIGRNFSGSIRGKATGIKKSAVLVSAAFDVFFEDLRMTDVGVTADNDQDRTPIVIFAPGPAERPANPLNDDGNDRIPEQAANPSAYVDNVGFIYSQSQGTGSMLLYSADPRVNFQRFERTYGNGTTKVFRVDGTLLGRHRTHALFFNGAQNEPAFTRDHTNDYDLEAASSLSGVRDVVGTVIARLQAQGILR